MPQIPQISGPLTGGKTLTSGNSGSNTPQGAEPFSVNGVNPVQRPAAVDQKGGAAVGENNQGVQGNLNGSGGVPVAKDPSMAVETLHDVFSGDLLENAKLNGYTELVGEIDDLTKAIYINPDKLMNEILTQEKDNTVFSGDPLFDILRQVSSGAGDDTKELVANLLKALNYAMSRNEIITAVKSNIRFLADYFGQNTTLSKNLNALYEKWDAGNPAENFEQLKNETAALMRTISESLQNDSKTEVLVPLVTHNLSRYNTNEYMMKDAFSQLMSQIPSASARETLNKSFAEYVTNLLKANANGYTETAVSSKDVSAEKAAILIYLSNIARNGEKGENGSFVYDSANVMNTGSDGGETLSLSQDGSNAPQINGGEPMFDGSQLSDKEVVQNGQQLFDNQGQPIQDQKGEPVFISKNQLNNSEQGQQLFDSQGSPILNQKGEFVFISQNQLNNSEQGRQLFDSQGSPILNQKGEPVFISQNQLNNSEQGQQLFDSQGRLILNQNGEYIQEFQNQSANSPNAEHTQLFDSSGQPILNQKGEPVIISQDQLAEKGQGRQLFSGEQPVFDEKGEPVFIKAQQGIEHRENSAEGAEENKKTEFDLASYRRLVSLSENRINYIVNNYKSGVIKGRDAIDHLLNLLIPKSAPDAAEVMRTAINGTDNLSDMVNFLNKVLENTPDVPERQMLCDAFEEILGMMAKNQEMPTQKSISYESETMKALTAFIDRNVNHPAIRGIDNFNASNLLQSMLNAPGVFTPLAHYIIPLQVEDTRAFGELWVDNDNSSRSGGEDESKHYHLFLTFDVEAVGRFEVDAYSKGSDLNLSVLYPKSYRYRVSSLTDKITRIAAGVGYNVQNFKTGILIKPHSLAETFPRIKENRRSFDVKA